MIMVSNRRRQQGLSGEWSEAVVIFSSGRVERLGQFGRFVSEIGYVCFIEVL